MRNLRVSATQDPAQNLTLKPSQQAASQKAFEASPSEKISVGRVVDQVLEDEYPQSIKDHQTMLS
jgi:hypothetical protein